MGKGRLTGIIVVEERIQPSPIDISVRRIQHTQPPCRLATRGFPCAENGEVRIVPPGKGHEGCSGYGARLVIRRFRLDESHEDVLGAVELVLIQSMMLD